MLNAIHNEINDVVQSVQKQLQEEYDAAVSTQKMLQSQYDDQNDESLCVEPEPGGICGVAKRSHVE